MFNPSMTVNESYENKNIKPTIIILSLGGGSRVLISHLPLRQRFNPIKYTSCPKKSILWTPARDFSGNIAHRI